MSSDPEITSLLRRWTDGDEEALQELTPLVYGQLQKLAVAAFRGEREQHTLQPTAIINEAYLQLADASIEWQDSSHFFSLAARMMRRILVNHANARRAAKRGGDQIMLTYHESRVIGSEQTGSDVLELDAAIVALAEIDAQKSEILELHYFGGLTYTQIGDVFSCSEATVKRELRFAKAWMRTYLDQSS